MGKDIAKSFQKLSPAQQKQARKKMYELVAKRIAKHAAPPIQVPQIWNHKGDFKMVEQLTTEQLMEAAFETVKQMSPAEKAKLRQQIDKALLTKTAKRLLRSKDVLRDMPCDPREN